MTDNIRAMGKNILIEKMENDVEQRGVLVIPENARVDSYAFAKVVSAAEGYYDKYDKYIKMSVKAGDIIVYKEELAMKLDKRLFLLEEHVFAVVG